MTFGVLDWTADNLPVVLKAYQARNPAGYLRYFGPLNLPTRGSQVSAAFVCEGNKQARFICDPAFHSAFEAALSTPDFRKAQIDVAKQQYEDRLLRYAGLGLKTEYGAVAMAVLGNNLRRTPECRPEAWKSACANAAGEKELVQCMLERYVAGSCRGSRAESLHRMQAISRVFAGSPPGDKLHPSSAEIIACSTHWDDQANGRPSSTSVRQSRVPLEEGRPPR